MQSITFTDYHSTVDISPHIPQSNNYRDSYFDAKYIFAALLPVLKGTVEAYLAPEDSSKLNAEDYRTYIVIDSLQDKYISQWPIEKVMDCFYQALMADDYLLSTFVITSSSLDVNSRPQFLEPTGSHRYNWLHKAIIESKNKCVEALLQCCQTDVNAKTVENHPSGKKNPQHTPLHVAIIHANKVALELLLLREDIDLTLGDHERWRPFERALEAGFGVDCFEKILGNRLVHSCTGFTLLVACRYNIEKVALPLIKTLRREVNFQTAHQRLTPLFVCVKFNANPAIIEALLYHPHINVNVSSMLEDSLLTPLHAALKINNMHAFSLLMAHPHIDVNKQEDVSKEHNRIDSTPLNTAIRVKNTLAVEILLSKKSSLSPSYVYITKTKLFGGRFGVGACTVKVREELTTLRLAAEEGNEEIATMIRGYRESETCQIQ